MAIVYIHRRLDIEDNFKNVFYVGIGSSKKRIHQNTGRNKYWHNIVNCAGYSKEITHDNLSIEEARCIEKYLISFYGRQDLGNGNLCNVTDGGELNCGRIKSLESIQKHRLSLKGFKHSEETKIKMSQKQSGERNAFYGKKHKNETINKLKQLAKNRPINELAIQRMKEYNLGRIMSDESKLKLSNSRKGIIFSEEHKNKLREARLNYIKNKVK